MTLPEFKAWFEGFTESMDGAPSEKQWKRIKVRVAEITGTPLTYPVYVDRYVEPYRRWATMTAPVTHPPGQIWASGVAMNTAYSAVAAAADEQRRLNNDQTVVWDAQSAMNALGKADAAVLKEFEGERFETVSGPAW